MKLQLRGQVEAERHIPIMPQSQLRALEVHTCFAVRLTLLFLMKILS